MGPNIRENSPIRSVQRSLRRSVRDGPNHLDYSVSRVIQRPSFVRSGIADFRRILSSMSATSAHSVPCPTFLRFRPLAWDLPGPSRYGFVVGGQARLVIRHRVGITWRWPWPDPLETYRLGAPLPSCPIPIPLPRGGHSRDRTCRRWPSGATECTSAHCINAR